MPPGVGAHSSPQIPPALAPADGSLWAVNSGGPGCSFPGWPAEDSRRQGTLVGGSDGFAPISVSPRAHGMSGVWGAHRLVPMLDGRFWGIAAACPFPAPPSQCCRAEGQHVQLGHSRKSLASLSHKPLSREGAASCLLVQPTPTGVGTNPDLCPRGSVHWGPRL